MRISFYNQSISSYVYICKTSWTFQIGFRSHFCPCTPYKSPKYILYCLHIVSLKFSPNSLGFYNGTERTLIEYESLTFVLIFKMHSSVSKVCLSCLISCIRLLMNIHVSDLSLSMLWYSVRIFRRKKHFFFSINNRHMHIRYLSRQTRYMTFSSQITFHNLRWYYRQD